MTWKLDNSVVLGETMFYDGYNLTKDQVREILKSDITEVITFCTQCTPRCEDAFPIIRSKTALQIGCCRFYEKELQAVKEWLAEVPVAVEAEKS